MWIDRAGYPFVLGGLVPAAVLFALRLPTWALAFVALACALGLFFRDPHRIVPKGGRLVVAPADGKVMHAGPADPSAAPDGEWLQVSVFLSPLDVHVNRTPVGGRVMSIERRPGRFLPAYRAASAGENERSQIQIDHQGRVVIVRQVVGVLARRLVCRLRPGMDVQRGDRLGIMKFGSRMDVFLPPDAVLRVGVGERVRGGESVIAELPPAGEMSSEE